MPIPKREMPFIRPVRYLKNNCAFFVAGRFENPAESPWRTRERKVKIRELKYIRKNEEKREKIKDSKRQRLTPIFRSK